MPDYLKDFKQEYEKIVKKEEKRVKLPVLSQMTSSLKSRLSLMPTAGSLELEKVEGYLKEIENTNSSIVYNSLVKQRWYINIT